MDRIVHGLCCSLALLAPDSLIPRSSPNMSEKHELRQRAEQLTTEYYHDYAILNDVLYCFCAGRVVHTWEMPTKSRAPDLVALPPDSTHPGEDAVRSPARLVTAPAPLPPEPRSVFAAGLGETLGDLGEANISPVPPMPSIPGLGEIALSQSDGKKPWQNLCISPLGFALEKCRIRLALEKPCAWDHQNNAWREQPKPHSITCSGTNASECAIHAVKSEVYPESSRNSANVVLRLSPSCGSFCDPKRKTNFLRGAWARKYPWTGGERKSEFCLSLRGKGKRTPDAAEKHSPEGGERGKIARE
jgi:hypothetical protein